MSKDIELLEGYVEWVTDQRMFPSSLEPKEYLQYLQNERNKVIIDKITEYVKSNLKSDDCKNLLEILEDAKE